MWLLCRGRQKRSAHVIEQQDDPPLLWARATFFVVEPTKKHGASDDAMRYGADMSISRPMFCRFPALAL